MSHHAIPAPLATNQCCRQRHRNHQLFMACVFQLKIRDLRINGMITVKLSDSGNEFVDQSQYDKTKKRRRLIVCVIFIVSKLAMPF